MSPALFTSTFDTTEGLHDGFNVFFHLLWVAHVACQPHCSAALRLDSTNGGCHRLLVHVGNDDLRTFARERLRSARPMPPPAPVTTTI